MIVSSDALATGGVTKLNPGAPAARSNRILAEQHSPPWSASNALQLADVRHHRPPLDPPTRRPVDEPMKADAILARLSKSQ
jgi:hypothetical protein